MQRYQDCLCSFSELWRQFFKHWKSRLNPGYVSTWLRAKHILSILSKSKYVPSLISYYIEGPHVCRKLRRLATLYITRACVVVILHTLIIFAAHAIKELNFACINYSKKQFVNILNRFRPKLSFIIPKISP